jgi:hypothetical protein
MVAVSRSKSLDREAMLQHGEVSLLSVLGFALDTPVSGKLKGSLSTIPSLLPYQFLGLVHRRGVLSIWSLPFPKFKHELRLKLGCATS